MTTPTTASARATSAHTPFDRASVVAPEHHLFSVAAGTPPALAITTAIGRLSAALETLEDVALELPAVTTTDRVWASYYTAQTALALVQSIELAVSRALPREPVDHGAPQDGAYEVIEIALDAADAARLARVAKERYAADSAWAAAELILAALGELGEEADR